MQPPKASLVRSALCLTTAYPRPSPTLFYYPGLESKPIYDTRRFAWADEMKRSLPTIRAEYEALKRVQTRSDYNTAENEHKLHMGKWDWHSYVTKGCRQTRFEKHCPRTSELLQQVPSFMTDIPFAYAFFSTLSAQSSINPHSSPCNIRLRVHFPLYVPPKCTIRVADQVREWQEGECLVFDDSYDHQVWNDHATDDRVVLLFDIWHPDLQPAERTALIKMFQTQ